jgi:hypothetical protein
MWPLCFVATSVKSAASLSNRQTSPVDFQSYSRSHKAQKWEYMTDNICP